jgi:glycerophosphoryl diester phosphodiesterase
MAIILILGEQGEEQSEGMPQENMNTQIKRRLNYLLALVVLVHSAFFLSYWFAVGRFRSDVDAFIAGLVNLSLPYIAILMVLTALIGLWSLLRFISLRLAQPDSDWKPSALNWVFLAVGLLFLMIFYAAFWMILREEPGQKGILIHLLNLVRVVTDAAIFLWLANWLRRLILFFRRRARESRRKWVWSAGIVLILVTLIGLWVIPTLFPPNWAYQGDLPTRPALIAHRGASMLSPENTLAALELASVMQALGFESDLRISLDGVPFLMHDATLARTTNIAEVFPDRINDRAESFTIAELKQLNAGLWYIQKDPYGMIDAGFVSQTQLGINQGQKIPTLAEALSLIKKNDMVFLFDLRYPPETHPFYDTFFEVVFEKLRESTLNGDIWFLLEEDQLAMVADQAPQMTRVAGISSQDPPSAEALAESAYEIVNVDTGISQEMIEAYRERGLGVNIYTIDETWLFSQFWLAGVTSITTNNVHTFSQLDRPFLAIPYPRFLLIWSIFGIVIAIWLASSQPSISTEAEAEMQTPDLKDFAMDEEDMVDMPHDVPENEEEGS